MSAIYLNGTKLTGADNASNVVAQDVLGLVEQAGDDTTVQALLDEIADRVADKLLTKTAASSLYLPQSVQNVVGCKNLLPNKDAVTQALDGVTFTVNSDGSITVNGTATAAIHYPICWFIPAMDDVILTGCPAGGSNSTYELMVGLFDSPYTPAYRDYGDGISIPTIITSGNGMLCKIIIRSGTVCNNLVFRPMLRPASYKDSTYEPYAMTNRELTAAKDLSSSVAPATSSNYTLRNINCFRVGNVVSLQMNIANTAQIADGGNLDLGYGSIPRPIAPLFSPAFTGTSKITVYWGSKSGDNMIRIRPTGNVIVAGTYINMGTTYITAD